MDFAGALHWDVEYGVRSQNLKRQSTVNGRTDATTMIKQQLA